MIAFVTGATGFIGSHVTEKLIERGYTVRCLARKSSNLQWLKNLPIELVDGSLDNPESLIPAVKNADLIFHVAGLTAARSPEEFMRGNKTGTENLLKAVVKSGEMPKRFLHVSSQAAVGPSESLEKPTDERTEFHPITSYGKSKKAAEEVVLSAMNSIPCTIVRPPAVYGPRDVGVYTFFQSVNRGIAPLIGFEDKYVSLVHSDDLSRGIVEAAESANTVGKTYFVASEEFYTWNQICDITTKVLNKRTAIRIHLPHTLVMGIAGISGFFGRFSAKPPIFDYEKGRDIIQSYWTCSVEAAKRDFGYRQKVAIEDGIRSTVQWYKERKWL